MNSVDSALPPGARQDCARCLRALCICQLARPQVLPLRVLIWQHPDEVRHVKGSARLLHLCLPNSHIFSAEQLSLEQVLESAQLSSASELALLYPNGALAGEFASQQSVHMACIKTLLLIDASWRDSRKILRLNPYLLNLPRYALQHHYPPRYHIRKAHKEGQLSSMEAGIYALQELAVASGSEHDQCRSAVDAAALLAVFDAFVALQAQFFLR